MLLLGTTPPSVANASAFEELPKTLHHVCRGWAKIKFNAAPQKAAVKDYNNPNNRSLSGWNEWDYNDFTTIKIDRNIQNGTLTFSPAQPAYLLSRPHYKRDRFDCIYPPQCGAHTHHVHLLLDRNWRWWRVDREDRRATKWPILS